MLCSWVHPISIWDRDGKFYYANLIGVQTDSISELFNIIQKWDSGKVGTWTEVFSLLAQCLPIRQIIFWNFCRLMCLFLFSHCPMEKYLKFNSQSFSKRDFENNWVRTHLWLFILSCDLLNSFSRLNTHFPPQQVRDGYCCVSKLLSICDVWDQLQWLEARGRRGNQASQCTFKFSAYL